ncbi:MAG TPA: DUF1398 family protein [Acidobacteriaceae bacterium]|jgi:uncharacterized protein YbcV (DUF1398 family)|nr:DUF1398 family protein [Acidobacteriaceae bacterium]
MNSEAMHAALEGSERGQMVFPEVVGTLMSAGVESYYADLLRREYTYYMPNGEAHVERGTLPEAVVAEEFSRDGIVAAIRGAQADTVRYPEFVRLATAAGAAGYHVFLTGRRAVYFGRKGEIHIEEFPGSK